MSSTNSNKTSTIDFLSYHDHKNVSQSDLKTILESPRRFKSHREGDEEEDKLGYLIGGMVDTKIFSPDDFNKLYVLRPEEMNTPSSPNQTNFCAKVLEGQSIPQAYFESYKSARKLTDSKVKEKAQEMADSFDTYLQYVANVNGRREFKESHKDIVRECIASIKSHPKARDWLLEDGGQDEQRESQVAIVSNIMGVDTKAMLDRVHILPGEKIIRNIDYKTTGFPLHMFWYYYRKWKYNFQQAFYGAHLSMYLRSLGYDPSEWDIRTYVIATETSPLHETRVFSIPSEALKDGSSMIKDALRRLKWHRENNKWKYSIEEYSNKLEYPLVWRSYND